MFDWLKTMGNVNCLDHLLEIIALKHCTKYIHIMVGCSWMPLSLVVGTAWGIVVHGGGGPLVSNSQGWMLLNLLCTLL